MATIDLKLKTYDELIFEITKLNTDKYLLEQKVDRLNNIIDELEKYIKDEYNYYDKYGNAPTGYAMGALNRVLDKLKELKSCDNK